MKTGNRGSVLPFGLGSKKIIDDLKKIARIGELVAQEQFLVKKS
jgi:hypothetical protein